MSEQRGELALASVQGPGSTEGADRKEQRERRNREEGMEGERERERWMKEREK